MRDALETVDYDIVPHGDTAETYKVRLLAGPYATVEYVYGEVAVNEDEGNDELTLSFNYVVLKAPEGVLFNHSDFDQTAGWVLESLLKRISSDAYIGKKEDDDSDRDTDLEESAD